MRAARVNLPAGASCALILALLSLPALADVVHLKNGGTITADSWEVSGDQLVIRQGTARIKVPRSDVVRIEPSGGPSSGGDAPAAGAPVQALGTGSMSEDEMQRAVDELKRRLGTPSIARAENTRHLVALLDQLGARAFRARDYDAALSRFREALGYEPRDARAQLGLAATYLQTDRDHFARSTLEGAIVDHPQDPDLHALLGDVYDRQERTAEALSEWKKAYELKPGENLKAKIDKLVRERSVDESYRQSDGAHFTLKYDGQRTDSDLGAQILDFLESQFKTLETRFDHYPVQPIVVILYPQRQFHEATRAGADVAGLYDGKIRVPIGGLRRLDASARAVLVHELAHAFIAAKSRGTAPRWLHEGLAQRLEGQSTGTATATALAKEFAASERKEAWGEAFTYASSLSFVEYLEERLGFPALVDLLEEMGRGIPAEEAFRRLTRDSLAELRQAWGEELVRKNLH